MSLKSKAQSPALFRNAQKHWVAVKLENDVNYILIGFKTSLSARQAESKLKTSDDAFLSVHNLGHDTAEAIKAKHEGSKLPFEDEKVGTFDNDRIFESTTSGKALSVSAVSKVLMAI